MSTLIILDEVYSSVRDSRKEYLAMTILPVTCKNCGGKIHNLQCAYCGTNYTISYSAPKVLERSIPQSVIPQPQDGPTLKVRKHHWIQIENDYLRSGNVVRGRGDTASIQEGGTLKIIGEHNGRFLVRYRTRWNRQAYGAAAPSGAEFYVTPNQLTDIAIVPSGLLHVHPLSSDLKIGDRVIDITAEQNAWLDLTGKVIEIDGSQVSVLYDTGNQRWKKHTNLRKA